MQSAEQCQEIKKDIIPDTPNIYRLNREFLRDCTDFVININRLDGSPWSNDGIVRWATAEQGIRLTPDQQRIVRFLQYRYFQKNQPCFVKQSFIARELDMHRVQVNRSLKSLEDKGLIVRIQWLYKGRRKNSIILPLIPSITPLFQDRNLPDADFQNCYIKCNNLFCKPPESQRFPKPFILYTNILYTNKLFTINKVTVNNILSEDINVFQTGASPSDVDPFLENSPSGSNETPLDNKTLLVNKTCLVKTIALVKNNKTPLDSNAVSVDNGEDTKGSEMLERFLLKRKERENNNVCQPIFNQLKLKYHYDFNKLSFEHQGQLNAYIDFFHGINMQTHFKISQNGKNPWYNEYATVLRSELIKIISNGYELQWEFADKVIQRWNECQIDDKRFQKLNIGERTSKAYINAVIAISHCLIFDANQSCDALFTAIDRLPYAQSTRRYPFSIRSKITIDNFFSNPKARPYLQKFLGSEIEWKRFIFEYKVSKHNEERIKIAYDRFIEMYVDQFYINNPDKGKENCYIYEFVIKEFLERRIDEIRFKGRNGKRQYRNMEGYSLINDTFDEHGAASPPLLQRFFFYRYRKADQYGIVTNRFIEMLSDASWSDFIETHMQIEVGLSNFYKMTNK